MVMNSELNLPFKNKKYKLRFLIQPILDISSGKLFAYECLSSVRAISNNEVLDNEVFFEKLSELELEMIVNAQIKEVTLYKESMKEIKISINMPISLVMKPDFLESIYNNSKLIFAIEVTHLDFHYSELEIVKERMNDLKSKFKFSFWLDDYLEKKFDIDYLTALPWDIVKLDKSTLRKNSIFVDHLIKLSNLGFDITNNIVVEGVEDKSTHKMISQHNLKAQGFYYGKPQLISRYLEARPNFDKLYIDLLA